MEHVPLELSCEESKEAMSPKFSKEEVEKEPRVSMEPNKGNAEGGAVMMLRVDRKENAGEGYDIVHNNKQQGGPE